MNKIDEIALRVAGAYEALSEIDGCARMDIGVDAMGPRKVLERFIADVEKLAELSKYPAPVIASEQKPVAFTNSCELEYLNFKRADGGLVTSAMWKELDKDADIPLFTTPPNTADIEQRVAEACAKFVSQGARDLAEQYGSDDMGSLSFGGGLHGEVRFDRYNELMELDDDIRSGKWREYL